MSSKSPQRAISSFAIPLKPTSTRYGNLEKFVCENKCDVKGLHNIKVALSIETMKNKEKNSQLFTEK